MVRKKPQNRSNKTHAKKSLKKSYSLPKVDFSGSYFVLFSLFLVGIFLPPVMSMMVIYFLQRVIPKKPRLVDRNLFVFSITLLALWIFSMSLSGVGFFEALSKSLLGSLFVIVVVYPFVFAWLHFDWNYRTLRN